MLTAMLVGRPASADPIADKKAQAARLAAQLEAKARAAEILTEQYNGARLKAGDAQANAKKAVQALAAAEATAKKAEVSLKQTAVQVYVHGGFLPMSENPSSPEEALDLGVRRKYMNVVADRQADALSESRVARADADRQRVALEAAEQSTRQALTAVESKRGAAAAAVKEQQTLLNQVKGELSTLVAAEQQRKAAEEARRVQARLATPAPASGGSAPLLNRSTGTAPTNPPPPPNAGAATAVAEAKKQLGKPYQWVGSGPDTFDCSGLTAWAWKAAGKSLAHYTGSQYSATARVAIADLQPGDLVFFGSDLHHVGLYVGSGQMIHAPQTGSVVKYDTIYRSDLVQSGGRVY